MQNIWDQFYKKRGRFYVNVHPQIGNTISKFKLFGVSKVLDLGCGSGRVSIRLAKEGFRVIGIDFSKEAIKLAEDWAKKENLEIDFLKRDFRKKLPFEKPTFDAVIAIDCIHYDSTSDVESILGEIHRVLKKDGFLFVTLPTKTYNPLITHLIFEKNKIKQLLDKNFKILRETFDKNNFLCLLCIKN